MAYTKTNWVNGETPINATNLNKIENGIENNDTSLENKLDKTSVKTAKTTSDTDTYSCNYINNYVKAAVWKQEYLEVGTSLNVSFSTMFPNLTLSNVICFIAEIINVDKTWDRTYANILASNGTLQVRSYAQQQTLTVRVTALYK